MRRPKHGNSVSLFANVGDYYRALYDMAAVAIVKNPAWASAVEIPAPTYVNGNWQERADNQRKITVWENFDRDAIIGDFFATMDNFMLVY